MRHGRGQMPKILNDGEPIWVRVGSHTLYSPNTGQFCKLTETAVRLRGLEVRLELEHGQEAVERARQAALTSLLSYERALRMALEGKL